MTFYDTANVYGNGHSEELLGQAFSHRRDRVVIATKAGMRESYSGPDFSVAGINASLEASLRRLKTDYVDILQLHNPVPNSTGPQSEVVELLLRLREEGKIRAYGVSAKTPSEGRFFIETPGLVSIQVNFNLLDWRAVDLGILSIAKESGIGIIARTPLAFGFLAENIERDRIFAPADHRSRWSRAQIINWVDAANEMKSELKLLDPDISLSAGALRFCLSFDGVTSVIPGMLTPPEVIENTASEIMIAYTSTQLERLKRIYRRHEVGLAS